MGFERPDAGGRRRRIQRSAARQMNLEDVCGQSTHGGSRVGTQNGTLANRSVDLWFSVGLIWTHIHLTQTAADVEDPVPCKAGGPWMAPLEGIFRLFRLIS